MRRHSQCTTDDNLEVHVEKLLGGLNTEEASSVGGEGTDKSRGDTLVEGTNTLLSDELREDLANTTGVGAVGGSLVAALEDIRGHGDNPVHDTSHTTTEDGAEGAARTTGEGLRHVELHDLVSTVVSDGTRDIAEEGEGGTLVETANTIFSVDLLGTVDGAVVLLGTIALRLENDLDAVTRDHDSGTGDGREATSKHDASRTQLLIGARALEGASDLLTDIETL